MIEQQDGELVISFRDAKSAVAWADELCVRPDVGSQIGRLLSKPGNVSKQDVLSVAYSISAAASSIEPKFASVAFKYVYGNSDENTELLLSHLLCNSVYSQCEQAQFIDKNLLRILSLLTLQSVRQSEGRGMRPIGTTRMAKILGIKQPSLHNKTWSEIRQANNSILTQWLDIAERKIEARLEEKGIFWE